MAKYLLKINSEIEKNHSELLKNYFGIIEKSDDFMINLKGVSELSLQSLYVLIRENGLFVLKESKLDDVLCIKLKRK